MCRLQKWPLNPWCLCVWRCRMFNCNGSSLSGCRLRSASPAPPLFITPPAAARHPARVSVCGSLCFCRQPFGSCQIVSCGCHTLRISNAPYAASLQTKNPVLSTHRLAAPGVCVKCQCLCFQLRNVRQVEN